MGGYSGKTEKSRKMETGSSGLKEQQGMIWTNSEQG